MPKKPAGYGKRGRPTARDIKNLKSAKAIMDSKTLSEAYLKTHPNTTPENARKNCRRMLNEEILDSVKELLDLERIAETNRDNLEKMLQLVVARYINREETGNVYVSALKLLTQLVPEFKERYELRDEIDKKSEADIDKVLKDRYGINPERLKKFNRLN